MLSFLINTLFLALAVILTYLWTNNPNLNHYNLQLTGLLVIVYFFSRLFLKRVSTIYNLQSTLIFTAISLLLVFSTGGLTSPLFFLLDFLLFGLALFLEPYQAGATAIILCSILFFSHHDFDTAAIINLISLLLTTPIAIIFGRKFLESQAAQGKINLLEKTLADEETDTLLWLTTKTKPTLTSIIDSLSQIIASNRLPFSLQDKAKEAYTDLVALHRSASTLEKEIDSPSVRPTTHERII